MPYETAAPAGEFAGYCVARLPVNGAAPIPSSISPFTSSPVTVALLEIVIAAAVDLAHDRRLSRGAGKAALHGLAQKRKSCLRGNPDPRSAKTFDVRG